eukprot:scaffold144228_cov166-Phaeocystis_antarctica.AAC.1
MTRPQAPPHPTCRQLLRLLLTLLLQAGGLHSATHTWPWRACAHRAPSWTRSSKEADSSGHPSARLCSPLTR